MKKILIIDDDELVREDIRLHLEIGGGYDITMAADGREGLEIASDILPDVILCDVMMPGMDGFQVLNEVKKSPPLDTIAFIFLSAITDQNDIRRAMNMGADDYLMKPVNYKELITAIETRLEKHQKIKEDINQKLDKVRMNISMTLPHELRTPLVSIMGYATFLLEDFDSLSKDESKQMIKSILSSGKRLHHIIENYLFYVKLELAAADNEKLKEFIEDIFDSTHNIIKEAAIKQAMEAERNDDLELDIENFQISSISQENLLKLTEEVLSNAFKFSTPGSKVKVKVHMNNSELILSIKDRGLGMTESQIKEIGAYMQFDREEIEQQGAGLGLRIVKGIAELHGGKFEIKSAPLKGTEVIVKLPAAAGQTV